MVYEYYKDNETNELGIFGSLKVTKNFVNENLVSSNYKISDPLFRDFISVDVNNLNNVIQKKTNVFDPYNHLAVVKYDSDVDATDTANYSLNYTYDSNGTLLGFQKLSAVGTKLYAETYSVDSNFNVLERSISVPGSLVNKFQYNYNNLNQLVSYTNSQSTRPFEIAYDSDGRMIVDDLGNKYAYENFSDKITEIKNKDSAVVAQYSYYSTPQK